MRFCLCVGEIIGHSVHFISFWRIFSSFYLITIKGFGSGLGALAIALAIGEHLPQWQHLAIILLLGYVAYGLSIYFYTYAQRTIGAAKTSTYYALAPFIGALLSIVMLGEPVTLVFVIATAIMAAGCWIAAK